MRNARARSTMYLYIYISVWSVYTHTHTHTQSRSIHTLKRASDGAARHQTFWLRREQIDTHTVLTHFRLAFLLIFLHLAEEEEDEK